MVLIVSVCLLLVVLTTVIHYEVLRGLSLWLPELAIRPRAKLIVVILGSFIAHLMEIALYAFAVFALVRYAGFGSVGDADRFSFAVSLYFSTETFTSLGYGDVVPGGDVRLLAGTEALNGLLLIGWSASYAYIAMERFWRDDLGDRI
jgi:voltage-gated potassium channel Kch